MWPFKRKKYKDWFDDSAEKAKKKKRRIINLVTFLIIIIILIVNSIIYFKDNNLYDYANSLNKLIPYEMNENDLNLTWSKNKANVEVMQNKCSLCGLNKVSEDINAISIQSSENSPTKTLHLNFDELAYFANCVLNFNSQFTLIDFVWETTDYKATITTHFAYNLDSSVQLNATKFYFEMVYIYDFEHLTVEESRAKVINTGDNGTIITNPNYLYKLRIMLTQFILQDTPQPIKDITEVSEKDKAKESENFFKENDKTLCQMLGFNSINFLAGGIDYLI